jgi:hypothetical protein
VDLYTSRLESVTGDLGDDKHHKAPTISPIRRVGWLVKSVQAF